MTMCARFCLSFDILNTILLPSKWTSFQGYKFQQVLCCVVAMSYDNIGIYHECEGGIEISIGGDHRLASRVMTNSDRAGLIFISQPNTNNGFFFLLTTKYLILYW